MSRCGSLHAGMRALRPQGCVIDLAFYPGRGTDALRLGEEFHHNGLSLRCAQIGRMPRGLGGVWPKARLSQGNPKASASARRDASNVT